MFWVWKISKSEPARIGAAHVWGGWLAQNLNATLSTHGRMSTLKISRLFPSLVWTNNFYVANSVVHNFMTEERRVARFLITRQAMQSPRRTPPPRREICQQIGLN